jgi:hypothetical protein
MSERIGPYDRERIVLCSADASPKAQKRVADAAAYFFPGAKWVGGLRNAAGRLSLRFVILTTGHGMVHSEDVIGPYDMHIEKHAQEVSENWNSSVPSLLGSNRHDLLVFYTGGCPRKPYLEILVPILKRCSIACLVYGKPFMRDLEKTEEVVRRVMEGTTIEDLRSILRSPENLEFYEKESKETEPPPIPSKWKNLNTLIKKWLKQP